MSYVIGIRIYPVKVRRIRKEEEAARLAEEARLEAEAEAARAAAAAEEARKQRIIANTISGTDITYNPTMSVSDDDIWLMACIIDWEAGYQIGRASCRERV